MLRKKKILGLKIIIILICISLTFVSCSSNVEKNERESKEVSNSNQEISESVIHENPFDVRKAKVNDYVLEMKITEIKTSSDFYNAIVRFTGQVEISGQYTYTNSHEGIIFEPDKKSTSKLPKLLQDDRHVWFSFRNYEQAKEAFGKVGNEGKATVIVDDYYISFKGSEDYNTTILVEVLNKK